MLTCALKVRHKLRTKNYSFLNKNKLRIKNRNEK